MTVNFTYGFPQTALVFDAGAAKHRPASHPLLRAIQQPPRASEPAAAIGGGAAVSPAAPPPDKPALEDRDRA